MRVEPRNRRPAGHKHKELWDSMGAHKSKSKDDR